MRYNKHRSEQLTKEQSMYPYHAISSFGEGNSRRVHIVIQHSPTPRTTPEIHTHKNHCTTNSEPQENLPLSLQILNGLKARKREKKKGLNSPQGTRRLTWIHWYRPARQSGPSHNTRTTALYLLLYSPLSKFLITALFFARTKNPNSSLKIWRMFFAEMA